jgi:gluconolactonase
MAAVPEDLVPAGATAEKLAGDLKFTEGPVWMRDGFLVFSDIPAGKLYKWSSGGGLSTFRDPSGNANGNILDRQGRLITAGHGSRNLTRTEPDGKVTVLADKFEGKRFNSPNDVVVKSDGTIWFTDPPYGLPKDQQRELDQSYVFCLDPASGAVKIVASDFDRPNGLCFSPDEKRLYIADSGKPHHVRAFDVDVKANTLVGLGPVFRVIDPGAPDGMRCDERGNLWSTAGDGVHVFAPDAKMIGKIPVPERPANCCFGGEDGKTLFITARTGLYSIRTNVRGAK